MSLLGKLTRVLVGDGEREIEEIIPRLRNMYTACAQRSRQMARHAELTPHEAGRLALVELAAEEKDLAERLRRKIMELGGFAGDVRQLPEPLGAMNYWGRLVRDLEAHREAVQLFLEAATEITDEQPETADFLRRLALEEEIHAERLRALIARSDPQALD